MIEYQKIVGNQFLTYYLKRGESGLIERYVRNHYSGKMELDRIFYSYDHMFFNAMDDAMLWLNAFEAACRLGYEDHKRVYFMLVNAEASGNAFRENRTESAPLPFFENSSVDTILSMAKSYGVKYL